MANPEHLDIFRKGVAAWNQWRKEHPEILPDLRRANLCGADLRDLNLFDANLSRAKLDRANLSEVNLERSILSGASLEQAILSGANFIQAYLGKANLRGANFDRTILLVADLGQTILSEADFTNAAIGETVFINTDLSQTKGLENVAHLGPSTIGIDTLFKSQGKIPEAFLRGCGVPDSFIEYARTLNAKPFEFYSCFISYSSKDQEFAQRLYADLQAKGVRCWFAPEDLKIGDKFRVKIDETIRVYDKLLLVLSEHSVASDWVEKEVETAFEKEGQQKRTMLFPIRLDDAVMNIPTGWPADIRRTRHIGDFHDWETNAQYQTAFARLLRDLKASEPKPDEKKHQARLIYTKQTKETKAGTGEAPRL